MMFLSKREKERRYGLVREMMKRENIDSLLVVGNSGIGGPTGPGNFRYLTDFLVIFGYCTLLFFPESEPVMFVGADLTQYHALKQSWVDDVRISWRYEKDIVSVLKERNMNNERIGFAGMESIPASIFKYLCENLSSLEIVDVAEELLEIRFSKSKEEQTLLKKAAEIVDKGFEDVLQMIQPGVTEREIAGILEGSHRKNGSDRTFNIILSCPFPRSRNKNDSAIRLFYPTDRQIKKGDVIILEMTATFRGYWNQMVRAICVGKENRELSAFHEACLKSLKSGLRAMRPGIRTSEFVDVIADSAKNMGYTLNVPVGHYVGLDLIENRVNPEINLYLKNGTSAIIHPILSNANEDVMFWGQTFLVLDDQTISLNVTTDDLVVIS